MWVSFFPPDIHKVRKVNVPVATERKKTATCMQKAYHIQKYTLASNEKKKVSVVMHRACKIIS